MGRVAAAGRVSQSSAAAEEAVHLVPVLRVPGSQPALGRLAREALRVTSARLAVVLGLEKHILADAAGSRETKLRGYGFHR